MSHMIIDGRKGEFTDEKNVLSVIRKAGINIPTLCYHSELSTFGACRLCTVEDDRGKMFASCSEEPRDGMVIHTNSGRIRKYRKLIVELLLAAHCRDCTTCVKSGECEEKNGLVVYYTNRCPFTDYYVNGSLWVLAQEHNIPLKIIKLETMEQAQAVPTPATIFSVFFNGKFLTTDMSICVESRFTKLLKINLK